MRRIRLFNVLGCAALLAAVFACSPKKAVLSVEVTNPSDFAREKETVEVPLTAVIGKLGEVNLSDVIVKDPTDSSVLLSQLIDSDADGTMDAILFQTALDKSETKVFDIAVKEEGESVPETNIVTYARNVPERIDDFTWENDRIAFRMYGPKAQQLIEAGDKSGVISNGIDCWLKRVPFTVIDKWYKGYLTDPMFYHTDTGEGLDNYHVGSSRGCGGIAVVDGENIYSSKNYTAYRVLVNGPIRTVFELDYAEWDAAGVNVTETKKVTIDLGMSLCKFECKFTSNDELPIFSTGITLHHKQGETNQSLDEGWIRYWEPMPDKSELGTAVFAESILDINKVEVEQADASHIYATLKSVDNKIEYYVGYGWKKAGLFESAAEWDAYLTYFSKRLKEPIRVKY